MNRVFKNLRKFKFFIRNDKKLIGKSIKDLKNKCNDIESLFSFELRYLKSRKPLELIEKKELFDDMFLAQYFISITDGIKIKNKTKNIESIVLYLSDKKDVVGYRLREKSKDGKTSL